MVKPQAVISGNRRRGSRVYTVYISMKIRGRSLVVCLGLVCLSAAHGQQYTIQTLTGNGSAGFVGDGGDPAAAQLSSPQCRGAGFQGQPLHCRHRQSADPHDLAGGTITTIAGNGTLGYSGDGAAATAATLNSPSGLAFDSSGQPLHCRYGEQRDPQDHGHHHHHCRRRQRAGLPVMAATGARRHRRISAVQRPSLWMRRATSTSRTPETT